MRKTLLFIFFVFPIALWLVGCGGSGGGLSGTKDQPSISISPNSANMLVGQSTQFSANVQNLSDTHVSWTVQEANGGTVAATSTGAIYTAPWPVGIYHVVVKSVANPSLSATAMVSVTAKFAFLEELPSGDALPFSMTPMVGTLGTDGNIGIGGIIDQGTGKAVSVAMGSLTLSNDGTKATFDVETQDTSTSPITYYWDVYSANSDGSGSATQLTNDGDSFWPQFSADGRQILYMKGNWDIWSMNADGSNQHAVFSASLNNADAWSATLSPDGTKIAAELDWNPAAGGGAYYDGIAIMNADGSNPVPLTGNNGCNGTMPNGGWDEMPSFTHDGTQIMFSRYCTSGNQTDASETMYIINIDGTGLTQLYNGPTAGVLNYNPIAVGDKILFQTNQDTPRTYLFEIYSMNADGSGVTKLTNNSLYDGFDTMWYSGPTTASQQQLLRLPASRSALHGAAARAEKIKHLQQHHR